MRRILFVLPVVAFTFDFSPSAWAGHASCDDSLAAIVRTVDPALKPREREEVLAVIREVDAILGKLHPARDFRIEIQSVGKGAAYAGMQSPPELHLVRQMEIDGKRKNPELNRAVTAHEYGHALLAENLADYSVEGKRILHGLRDAKAATARALQKQGEMEAQLAQMVPDSPEAKVLEDELFEFKTNEVGPARQAEIAFIGPKTSMGYFDEFFGDFVATVVSGNPQAVSRVLEVGGASRRERHRARLRDFASRESWSRTERIDDYSMSRPLRRHLWENYLSRPSVMRRKPELMRAIMQAMGEGFDAFVARTGGRVRTAKDVNELNADMIRRVDKYFAPLTSR